MRFLPAALVVLFLLPAVSAVADEIPPPFGFRWMGLRAVQKKLSLLGVMWSVASNDLRWSADRVARYVIEHASPGAIISLHDGRRIRPKPDISVTLAAVKRIVPILKDQGYSFEVISDLLSETGPLPLAESRVLTI